MHIDVFRQDLFGIIENTAALDKVPYVPGWLGQQTNLFVPAPITTRTFFIEKIDGKLTLIKTSPIGAPVPHRGQERRDGRQFRTVRLALGDRLNAEEIQGIRATPGNALFSASTEVQQAAAEVLKRQVKLRRDILLTMERHRLGCIQGKVLDADDSVLYNWFSLWGIAEPTVIDFDLLNNTVGDETGPIETKCKNVIRTMERASKGSWVEGSTYVCGLAGDNFFDALVGGREYRQLSLGYPAAASLANRTDLNGREFRSVWYGNINFVNYRGTDDNSSVAVNTNACHFFPMGATDVFQHIKSPAESFDLVNTPGLDFYAATYPDPSARNEFVDLEVKGYPAFVCMRPEMLLKAKRTSADSVS